MRACSPQYFFDPSDDGRAHIAACRAALDPRFDMAVELRVRAWLDATHARNTFAMLAAAGVTFVVVDELASELYRCGRALGVRACAHWRPVLCVVFVRSTKGKTGDPAPEFVLPPIAECAPDVVGVMPHVTTPRCAYIRVHRRVRA